MGEVSNILLVFLFSSCVAAVLSCTVPCSPEQEHNQQTSSPHPQVHINTPLAQFSPRADQHSGHEVSTSTAQPPVGHHQVEEKDHHRNTRSMSSTSHHVDLAVLHDGHPIEVQREERSGSHHDQTDHSSPDTSETSAKENVNERRARSDGQAKEEAHHGQDIQAKDDHAALGIRGEERHKRHLHVDLGGYGYHGLPFIGYHGFDHDYDYHYDHHHHHHH